MTEPVYPFARTVAPAISTQVERLHAAARELAWDALAPRPSADVIERIVEVGFWASLRREEGRSPMISLAFLPPAQAGEPLLLDRQIPLSPDGLIRLAPAVERRGVHLGVWREGSHLHVWGATRTLPDLCFVLEVVEPGVLVLKYSRREEFGKFGNMAVLQGDRVKIVDEESARQPNCPVLLSSLIGIDPAVSWLDSTNVLVQLALSMRAHGHGGTLLVVPPGDEQWEDSIESPVPFRASPPFSRLADLVARGPDERSGHVWQQALRHAVDGLAGLTAVDGAMVMSQRYELLAFGAKIRRVAGSRPFRRVVVTEPVVGDEPVVVEPPQIGGTRHLSAAQFVHDRRGALALVASQDGQFTVFAGSERDDQVHAHRVESLLL